MPSCRVTQTALLCYTVQVRFDEFGFGLALGLDLMTVGKLAGYAIDLRWFMQENIFNESGSFIIKPVLIQYCGQFFESDLPYLKDFCKVDMNYLHVSSTPELQIIRNHDSNSLKLRESAF